MQKNFLRILELGQNDFWELLHDIAEATNADNDEKYQAWQKSLEGIPIYLWRGPKESAEGATFIKLLESFGLSMTVYNCSSLDAEAIQKKAAKRKGPALHITCGFSEAYLDILTSHGEGAWFTGYSPVNSPWAALAEIALFQSISPTIDSMRVSLIGAVDGLSQSLMEAAIYAPFELFMAVPPWGDPDHYQTGLALKSGAKVFMTREPQLALDDARLIYMDTRLAARANEKPADTTPLEITGRDNFSWRQGFTLTKEYKDCALPDAQVLTLTDSDDTTLVPDVDLELSAKRANFRKYALMASLAHTAKNG